MYIFITLVVLLLFVSFVIILLEKRYLSKNNIPGPSLVEIFKVLLLTIITICFVILTIKVLYPHI